MLIQGKSMEPTYHSNQLVFLNKQSDVYNIGDVVAFHSDSLNSILVKRIVAAPGDRIFLIENQLYVNDKAYYDCQWDIAYTDSEEILLNENEYFMVGDNFDESIDSRDSRVWLVNKDDLIGIVIPNKTYNK